MFVCIPLPLPPNIRGSRRRLIVVFVCAYYMYQYNVTHVLVYVGRTTSRKTLESPQNHHQSNCEFFEYIKVVLLKQQIKAI